MTATTMVLLMALAACGGDGTAATASTPAATALPVATPLNPADYVLTAGPATAGYTADDNTDTTESSVFEPPVPGCMHLSSSDLGPAPTDHANGPAFTDDDGTSINSGARVFASADTVAKHRALTQRADFPGCVGQAIVSQESNDDSQASSTTVKSATAGVPPAGATALTRLVLGVSSSSRNFQLNIDLISIFSGRVESVILVGSVGAPIADTELNGLVSQVAAKLAKQ